MKKIILALVSIVLATTLTSNFVKADDVEFNIKANIPENQVDKNLSYFDLEMNPEKKETISITVENSSNLDKKFLISPNAAKTNNNGVIDYSSHKQKFDKSMKYPLSEIASKPQKVTVKAHSEKNVEFTLEMPSEHLNGTILGGIYVTDLSGNKTAKQNKSSVSLINKFTLVKGVVLHENDKDTKPKLYLKKVNAGLSNYSPVIKANIQNSKAAVLSKGKLKAVIYDREHKKIAEQESQVSFAPNSNFDYSISPKKEELKAGNYELEMWINSKNTKQKWHFKKKFIITAKESGKIKKETISKSTNAINYWMILTILLLVLILLFIGYYFMKKYRDSSSKH